jgi:excisionase family DNA binding protein
MSPLHEKKYSTEDAAKLLGISKKTLLKWCKEKRVSYIRYPNGAFKFRESTLDFFLGHNTIPATNAAEQVPKRKLLRKAA